MHKPQKIAFAATVALALAGAAALPAFSAGDPQAAGQAAPAKDWHHEHHHGMGFMSPRFLDARIAFLKTALQITPAQEPAFDALVKVIRDNSAERSQLHQSLHAGAGAPKSTIDRLELHAKLAELHAKHLEAFVAAFKPLYDGLSDDQRKAADDLLAPRFHRG
jgi:hypothetical protein